MACLPIRQGCCMPHLPGIWNGLLSDPPTGAELQALNHTALAWMNKV